MEAPRNLSAPPHQILILSSIPIPTLNTELIMVKKFSCYQLIIMTVRVFILEGLEDQN